MGFLPLHKTMTAALGQSLPGLSTGSWVVHDACSPRRRWGRHNPPPTTPQAAKRLGSRRNQGAAFSSDAQKEGRLLACRAGHGERQDSWLLLQSARMVCILVECGSHGHGQGPDSVRCYAGRRGSLSQGLCQLSSRLCMTLNKPSDF